MRYMNELEQALDRFERRFGDLPLPSPAQRAPTYCRECDAMTQDVLVDGEPLECPGCGRRKGALELGTESVEAWHEMPDEAKPAQR